MQLTKPDQSNQVIRLKKEIVRTKASLKYITKQLTGIKDEWIIKLKLRQCDELNNQRIILENRLEGLQ